MIESLGTKRVGRHSRVTVGIVLIVIVLGDTACFQYRQQALEVTPASDCPDFSRGCAHTTWGLLWGAVYLREPPPADCGDVGLAEATVRTPPVYFLVTIISVGLVWPRSIEWKCAAPDPRGGEIRSDTTTATVP